MNPEDIVLSEISQSQKKTKYCINSTYMKFINYPSSQKLKVNGGYQGLGGEEICFSFTR
jgi:hypothetical protein